MQKAYYCQTPFKYSSVLAAGAFILFVKLFIGTKACVMHYFTKRKPFGWNQLKLFNYEANRNASRNSIGWFRFANIAGS